MFVTIRHILVSWLLLLSGTLVGQHLSFRYLGQSEGLRTISSWNCAIDAYGFFWIATPDGLVRFNGIETTYYYSKTHPELPYDQIGFIFCDSRNRIWVCTEKGLVCLDENRKLHRHLIDPSQPDRRATICFEGSSGEIYVMSDGNSFLLDTISGTWIRQPWLEAIVSGKYLRDIRRFDRDKYVIVDDRHGVIVVDTRMKKQHTYIPLADAGNVTRLDEEHILIGLFSRFGLFRASINDSCDIQPVTPPPGYPVDKAHARSRFMVKAIDGRVYINTGSEGLLSLDSSLTSWIHYTHDPVNSRTIIDDNLRYIVTDSSGNILLTTGDGVNYTNVRSESVTYINYVMTPENDILDHHVLNIAEDRQNRLWLCFPDEIIILHDDLTTTSRPQFPASFRWTQPSRSPLSTEQDFMGNMWISLRHEGIAVFDPDGRYKTFISSKNYPGFGKAIDQTRVLREGNDGYMYLGTESGLFRVRHHDLKLDTFPDDPAMAPLRRARVVDILFVRDGMWVATSPRGAAWHYTFSKKTLNKINEADGMTSNRVYGLTADLQNTIYAGCYEGLSVIHPDSTITTLTKDNGLISPRIESIESDDDGAIWFTNNYNVLKYEPAGRKISRLGPRQGLNGVDFVIAASTRLSSGRLAFGANKGFVIIDPSQLKLETPPSTLYIFYHDQPGQEILCRADEPLIFPYSQRNLRFSFVVKDILVADQYVFRYRISDGSETSWSAPSANATIDFNPGPGKYMLEVEAFDGTQWLTMPAPVKITIRYPWWLQWWFLSLVSILAMLILWSYYKATINRYRNELKVARQIAELESKALRAQMNPHFVFNCLNAIQECVVTGKLDEAYIYLSKFSRLLRLVLESSDQPVISLQQELEILDLYVSLEKLRFKDSFDARFVYDEELETDQIRIPSMMIQPHIENAIWHGLRHLSSRKGLRVSLHEESDYLHVTVEDNGVGRDKSSSFRAERMGSGNKHTSKGLSIGAQRIAILQMQYPRTRLEIEDLYHEDGKAAGTRVKLVLPIIPKI